jgi:chemotaxis family two-component system response regulator Rcp1
MSEQRQRKIDVLMVEDNTMDAVLTSEILSESERACYNVITVRNAVEALSFLHRANGYESAPLPDLVLLDLNLPRMPGLDFLAEIREDKNLTSLPVVVLTTSEFEKDIDRARKLGVSGYLVKPIDLEKFESMIAPRD